MPGYPVPHLIVTQAGLSFGTLKTLLDAMLSLGHARQLSRRNVRVSIRQVIIKLGPIIRSGPIPIIRSEPPG
jgi:hypothetical protein